MDSRIESSPKKKKRKNESERVFVFDKNSKDIKKPRKTKRKSLTEESVSGYHISIFFF